MASRYWVGGTATWNATAGTKWATSSGGTGGAAIPTSADDVFFDAASGSVTVTFNFALSSVQNIDFTGFTGTFQMGGGQININGSMTLSPTATYGDLYNIAFKASGNLVTNNVSLNGNGNSRIYFDSGTTILIGNLTNSLGITVNGGTFNSNGYTVNSLWFTLQNGTLNMGSSVFTLSGNDSSGGTGVWNVFNTPTLNAGTSSIVFTGSGTKTFDGLSKTYNDAFLSGAGTTILKGSNTFNELRLNPGTTVNFTNGTTQTVSTLTASGTAGNIITLQSTSSGSTWSISKSSGSFSGDYLSIKDSIATGGAGWYANTNSINAGNNTGWIFVVYNIACAFGSYALTGISNVFYKLYNLVASYGTFVLSGQNNNLIRSLKLITSFGQYIYTGFSASIPLIWRNQNKNISTWSESSKNDVSMLNKNKNISTYVNINKTN